VPEASGYLTRMLARRVRTDGFIDPCIPTLAAKPPSGPGWVHEIKHDGYRLIVRRDGKAVRLFTRRGYDWTDRYPAIAAVAAKLRAKSFTLDGEAVVAVAVFDALHRRHKAADAMLYAFDLLELNGEDLRPLPLGERKTKLARLLVRAPVGIAFNEHTDEDGAVVFRHACKMGLEGAHGCVTESRHPNYTHDHQPIITTYTLCPSHGYSKRWMPHMEPMYNYIASEIDVFAEGFDKLAVRIAEFAQQVEKLRPIAFTSAE
jgi:bifunctional non-homologous end joining protein LigD